MSRLREIALYDATVHAYLKLFDMTPGASWTLTMENLVIHLSNEKAELLRRVTELEIRKMPEPLELNIVKIKTETTAGTAKEERWTTRETQ